MVESLLLVLFIVLKVSIGVDESFLSTAKNGK